MMPVIARNEVPSSLLTVVEIASLGSVVGINEGGQLGNRKARNDNSFLNPRFIYRIDIIKLNKEKRH